MKTKISLLLTALLMLFCVGTNAQSIKGDVNGDNLVNDEDIEEVVKIITGTSELENPDVVGDVTGDSHVNVADIVAIVNIMQNPSNPAVTFSLKITNNTGSDVTLDGEVSFILGNPDHNNFYLGWEGPYNATDRLRFSETAVTIAAGESQTFDGICWKDEESGMGMGEKSPANSEQIAAARASKNVMVYVGGNPETVLCENMSTDIIFQQGGVYEIVLPGSGSDPVTPVNPPVVGEDHAIINFGVNITNNASESVTLNGDVVFVLGNPDHNRSYFGGYTGPYIRTDHINFSASPVTLSPGETKTFYGLTWRDGDTGLGMGEMSPADAATVAIAQRRSNVLLYVTEADGTGNSEIAICENMSSSTIFREGGVYDISISSISGSGSSPVTPVTPSVEGGDHAVVSFGLNITNAHGAPILLNGDVVFVLGNPDHNGSYFGGYTGPYIRTDHITFSSPVLLNAGETKYFGGLTWRDGDTGLGMGEMSPADAATVAIAQRRSNVLLYVTEADGTGNSEIVICDLMDPNTIFRDGGTYNVTFR